MIRSPYLRLTSGFLGNVNEGRPQYRILMHMREAVTSDAKRRLARISGQVNGIQRMVEEERYCVDILTQVAALRAALDQFGVLMLSTHLEECVYGQADGDHNDCKISSPAERIEEIKLTLNRFLK